MRQGKPGHQISHMTRLRHGRLQELPSGGNIVEQLLDQKRSSFACARIFQIHFLPAVDPVSGPEFLLSRLRDQFYLRDCRDTRQSLPAEAQRPDMHQIVHRSDLTGRMAQERAWHLVPLDSASVICNPYKRSPAVRYLHNDSRRPGVNGILRQLLDHGCGALDHLARRDLIYCNRI